MNIRVMCIEDYEEVYALWLRTPGMGLNDKDDSKEGIASYLKRNPMTCFVVEESFEILGVILSGHDGRRGYIHHTAVDINRRRMGIGKALVQAVMNALKAQGIHKVALVAFKRNESGSSFWKEMGFEVREDLNYCNKQLIQLKRIDV